jgi:type IV pilus assembly protein PilM
MSFSFSDLLKPYRNLVTRLTKMPRIGLYVGHEAVNLVQMEEAGQSLRIRAIAALPFPDAREAVLHDTKGFKALLERARSIQPFSGKHVVSSLSSSEVKTSMVIFKRQKGLSDEQALVAELRERMQGDLGESVVDFMALRHLDPDVEVGEALVAIAPRKNVLAYLDALSAAGLHVDALDVGPNALSRLVRHSGALKWREFPKLPNALLINVGLHSTFLSIIWGRRLILDRPVDFSEKRLLERLVKVLGMSDALALSLLRSMEEPGESAEDARKTVIEVLRPEMSALQQEINRTLVYMASKTRGKSVDIIFLSGCVARYPGLLSGFQQSLQVPVCVLNPLTLFASGPQAATFDTSLGLRPGIVLASGLALHNIEEPDTWT